MTFLTVKADPPNIFAESGLGENATSPTNSSNGCTDAPDCEIPGPASVSITSSTALSQIDVLTGSVQPTETFNVWTGNSLSTLSEVATGLSGTTCTQVAGNPGLCRVDFAAATIVAVQSAGVGDVLLTAVSTPSVPEPAALALLGSGLLGMGLFRRRRQ